MCRCLPRQQDQPRFVAPCFAHAYENLSVHLHSGQSLIRRYVSPYFPLSKVCPILVDTAIADMTLPGTRSTFYLDTADPVCPRSVKQLLDGYFEYPHSDIGKPPYGNKRVAITLLDIKSKDRAIRAVAVKSAASRRTATSDTSLSQIIARILKGSLYLVEISRSANRRFRSSSKIASSCAELLIIATLFNNPNFKRVPAKVLHPHDQNAKPCSATTLKTACVHLGSCRIRWADDTADYKCLL